MPKSKPYYGWFIVFLAFLSMAANGVVYSYGAFVKPLETQLGTTRTGISAAYTIAISVSSVASIPLGWLCDRFGPGKTLWLAGILIGAGVALSSTITALWQLYLLFGFVAGMGNGALFVVPTSTVSRWFIARRGLAMGLAIGGTGVGLLVMPPIATGVIETQDWRAAFLVLGIIGFGLNAIVGSLITGKPRDRGLKAYGESELKPETGSMPQTVRDYSTSQAVKSRAFLLIFLVCICAYSAEQMVLVHVIPYTATIGITPMTASFGLSLLGLGNVISRITSGACADRLGRVPTLIVGCLIEGAAIFALSTLKGPSMLFLAMFFVGFGYGAWGVVCPVLLGDFFGLKNLGTISGLYFTAAIPASFLGPLTGGIIYDMTKSYYPALMLATGFCIVAVILATRLKPPKLPDPEYAGAAQT